MDPGVALQAVRKIRLAVEHACNRAMPLAFRLNLHERTRGAQPRTAQFMLDDRRVPEIGGCEELTTTAAGHGDEVGDRPGRNTSGNGRMNALRA